MTDTSNFEAPATCKICQSAAPLLGVVDFNRHGVEDRIGRFPPSNIPIHYWRCAACGFTFTNAFDDWSPEQFRARIYNTDYVKVDPDYLEIRPSGNAESIVRRFGLHRAELACLDYGGGNGRFAESLRNAGFKAALTYDEHGVHRGELPAGSFDLVTCFEVFEHITDPERLVANLARLIDDKGLIYFSTLLQPPDIEHLGISWWYIAPRNGHISMYSRCALEILLTRHGLKWGSFNSNVHMAWRNFPAFAAHLLRKSPG